MILTGLAAPALFTTFSQNGPLNKRLNKNNETLNKKSLVNKVCESEEPFENKKKMSDFLEEP